MDLGRIFGVFSRREVRTSSFQAAADIVVPDTTRNRVLLWCGDLFSGDGTMSGNDCREEFWSEIHRALRYRHGRMQLSPSRHGASSEVEDALAFVYTCETSEFLDFLEDIFRVDSFWRYQHRVRELVRELNQLLRVDDVPFFLTDMVTEETVAQGPFGRPMPSQRVREYPRAVLRESGPLHDEVIDPALQLLARSEFAAADSEYLSALEDLRKGDYDDCLTKCCSAFESSMKVICSIRGWSYNATDTAAPMIKTIREKLDLPGYIETQLTTVATLRNRLGSAHGAGTQPREVSRALASYATQMTGAAILFLSRESGL